MAEDRTNRFLVSLGLVTAAVVVTAGCAVPAIAGHGMIATALFGPSGASGALGPIAQGTATSLIAGWIEKLGATDAAQKYLGKMMRRGGLPLNHDIERAVSTAVQESINYCIDHFEIAMEENGALSKDDGTQAFLADLKQKAKKHKKQDPSAPFLTAAELQSGLNTVLQALPTQGSSAGCGADALADLILQQLLPQLDRRYPAEWRRCTQELRRHLVDERRGFFACLFSASDGGAEDRRAVFRIVLHSAIAAQA